MTFELKPQSKRLSSPLLNRLIMVVDPSDNDIIWINAKDCVFYWDSDIGDVVIVALDQVRDGTSPGSAKFGQLEITVKGADAAALKAELEKVWALRIVAAWEVHT